MRAWLGPGGCTAIVEPGATGDVNSYRRLLESPGKDSSDSSDSNGGWRPSVRVVEAAKATWADLTGPLLVVGPVGRLVKAYLARTPFPQADEISASMPADSAIRAAGVNPWAPEAPMVVVSGSGDASVLAYLERSGWLRAPDYEQVLGGMRVRYGRYTTQKEGSWGIDASTEVDLRSRLAWVEEAGVRAVYVKGEIDETRARLVATRAAADLGSYLKRLGGKSGAARIELILYPDLEAKSVRTDDPRPSHLEPIGARIPRVHLVVPQGNQEPDRIGLARAAVLMAAGEVAPRALADGAALWLAGAMARRPLDWWAGRLSVSGLVPSADELFDEQRYRARSYLVGMPAAAMMMTRMSVGRSPSDLLALLRDPVRARRAAGESAQPPSPPGRPGDRVSRRPWTLPFQKGVGLAHEGFAGMDGYGSHASFAAMGRLRSLGADWVALSPFGFMRDPQGEEISFLRAESQNAGAENDAAVLATIAAAHRIGLRVMLKPQLWLHGGHWAGDISMRTEESWRGFFAQYREFLAHYALLGAAGDADMLVVGVEMQESSRRENDWRSLIALTRALYGGPLTYAANWGEEFERIGFWDALDYAGLDCYYPLDADPTAGDEDLAEGARSVAQRAERVARRATRPVILTEVGFPALAGAWVSPHDDRTGRPFEPEAQARGYRAILAAFWERPWLAGLYWWKWPTTPEGRGREPLFSPRGRPAEQVLSDWYARPRRGPHDWPGQR